MNIVISPENKVYLNLGCGSTWFPEWNNCDVFPRRYITSINLKQPLPWPDNSFDAVYSSHVLEHFTPQAGQTLLREMHRVLKPTGVCRIVVPDLEMICRFYLDYLENANNTPTSRNINRYNWITVELLDQMVREQSGGLMKKMLDNSEFDEELAQNRLGDNFTRHELEDVPPTLNRSDINNELTRDKDPWIIRLERRWVKTKLAFFGGGSNPRRTGEAHKWMYDRFSLLRLMMETGFSDCSVHTYQDSKIPLWYKYNLDVSKHGQRPRKPDSLYTEGIK